MGVRIYDDLPEEQFEEGYSSEPTTFPTVRDGRYEGTITFADDEVDPAEQWDTMDGVPVHYRTRLKATINGDGPFTGRRVFGRVSTKPFKAGKNSDKLTSTATRALNSIGEKDRAAEATTPVQLARAVTEVFASGTKAVFDVQLQASYQENGSWVNVRGEENFPKDDAGNPIPELDGPNGKVRGYPEFRIVSAA